ncbi:MAG: pseudouridine synthase [Oscillospiraceae bacterium]
MLIRIDKFISSQCGISRNTVKELCRKGRITANGKVCSKSDIKIDPDSDLVEVDGVAVKYREHVYIMLNKPKGYVCSTRDGASPTVLSLVPDELFRKGLFPAGRLDKDTEGFVLITDDGELAHRMLSPKSHVPKEYFVRLEKPWENSYAEKFSQGMVIDGGEKCLPSEFIPDLTNPYECRLILHEGKYHQVKRMFMALGNKVVFLKRTAIGDLRLDENLPLGSCLEILHKDVEKLLAL